MTDHPEEPIRPPRGATQLFDRIHMQGMLGALSKVQAKADEQTLSWFDPWLPKPGEGSPGQ